MPGPATQPAFPFIADEISKNTPWGEEVNGLVCRLLVNSKYFLGEPVSAIVEIRNVSKEELAFGQIFSLFASDWCKMEIDGPESHKKIVPTEVARSTNDPQNFKAIKPGETIQVLFSDLRKNFCIMETEGYVRTLNSFSKRGKYALVYSYAGQKPSREIAGVKIWKDRIESNTAVFDVIPLNKDNLKAHEWGVFSIYSDSRYANAGRRAEWESMPEFFYRQFPEKEARMKAFYVPTVINVSKPIIYFYSDRPVLKLQVTVDFPQGAPVVWWPCCVEPTLVFSEWGRESDWVFRKLSWEIVAGEVFSKSLLSRKSDHNRLGDSEDLHKASEYPVPRDSWVVQARLPKASLLTAEGFEGKVSELKRTRMEVICESRLETERFLYYDGVVSAPCNLKLNAIDAGSAGFGNTGKFDIQNLFVIDRRCWQRDKTIRFAMVEKVEAGKETKVALDEIPVKDWPAAAVGKVREALLKGGLFEAEADSMLKIWEKGFFEHEGVTAFYILPRAEYDRFLPLKIEPEPGEIVRVGVALHPQMKTAAQMQEFKNEVKELIGKLESNAVAVHQPAILSLLEMGPDIIPFIRKTIETNPSHEIRLRCRQILDQLDAELYIKEAGKGQMIGKEVRSRNP
ncbi:MAG: hypothetical protein HZA50_04650 [Planctomycetes bacterium]|nr:hypothetical protein [Planctomycetota bacterium]